MKRWIAIVAAVTTWCLPSTSFAQWRDVAKLVASNGSTSDLFAQAVGLHGELAVFGARNFDQQSGAAHVFRFDGASWMEETQLLPPAGEGGYFGISVDIDRDVIVCGAPLSAQTPPNGQEGAVWVYRHNGQNWVEEQKLVADDAQPGHWFGRSVAVSGDLIVVGARDDEPLDNSGSAYVFRFDGVAWNEEAKLRASPPRTDAYFGEAVVADGDLILVGEYGFGLAGTVYAFRNGGPGWRLEATLTSESGENDRFGAALSIDGNRLAIGASEQFLGGTGKAYVFQYDGGYHQRAVLTPPGGLPDDRFGESIVIRGDRVVVGASQSDSAPLNGYAQVFEETDGTWEPECRIEASDEDDHSHFGAAVAVRRNTLIVGASYADGITLGTGAAYVYQLTRSAPMIRGDVNQDGGVAATDGLQLLAELFTGATPISDCRDSADANDDGRVDIADVLSVFSHTVAGAPAPAPPFPDCGWDSTPDYLGRCVSHQACP